MPQPDQTIVELVSLLDGDINRTLTDTERALIRGALAELAGAQALIARQAALLSSYEQDIRAVESDAAAATGRVRALRSAPGPTADYDFGAADAARKELLNAVQAATSGRKTLDAVLRFVAAVVRLSL